MTTFLQLGVTIEVYEYSPTSFYSYVLKRHSRELLCPECTNNGGGGGGGGHDRHIVMPYYSHTVHK